MSELSTSAILARDEFNSLAIVAGRLLLDSELGPEVCKGKGLDDRERWLTAIVSFHEPQVFDEPSSISCDIATDPPFVVCGLVELSVALCLRHTTHEQDGPRGTWRDLANDFARLRDVGAGLLLKFWREGRYCHLCRVEFEKPETAIPEDGGIPEATPKRDEETGPDSGIGKLEHALALLVQYPTWTNGKIASTVGVARQTLYKKTWSKYQAAREALESSKYEIPRGSKDKDGNIEAWDGDTFGDTDD